VKREAFKKIRIWGDDNNFNYTVFFLKADVNDICTVGARIIGSLALLNSTVCKMCNDTHTHTHTDIGIMILCHRV
jgi:hypothetical protein